MNDWQAQKLTEQPEESAVHIPDSSPNPKTRSRRKNQGLLDLVYISLFTALIAVCSQICIPTPPGIPPVTLQTLGVFLAGGFLGWKRGSISVLVYLVLGTIGVPVFAQFSSGFGVLLGMTGGYLIGFLFTAAIVGLLCQKLGRKLWVSAVSMTAGLLICYVFGTAWFMVVYAWQMGPIGLWEALGLCVFPFLLFDAGKIVTASILVNRLDKVIRL